MTKKVALVLGGGGVRGGAHIGVIKTLEEANVPIDMIVGSSMGAIVGALYAKDKNPELLKQIYEEGFSLDTMFRLIDPTLIHGFLDSEKLERWLEDEFRGVAFNELKIPLVVVATDLETGETVYITEGDVAKAVRAAVSATPLILPVELDGKILTDAWITEPLSTKKARELGAEIVIASVIDPGANANKVDIKDFLNNKLGYLTRSFNIMSHQLIKENIKHADVVMNSDVSDISMGVGISDFTDKEALVDYMEAGVQAAIKAIPEISKKLGG